MGSSGSDTTGCGDTYMAGYLYMRNSEVTNLFTLHYFVICPTLLFRISGLHEAM